MPLSRHQRRFWQFEGFPGISGQRRNEFADTDPGELQVGLPLRMVYRIKDFDRNRGFRRYFWKATPVRDTVTGREGRKDDAKDAEKERIQS